MMRMLCLSVCIAVLLVRNSADTLPVRLHCRSHLLAMMRTLCLSAYIVGPCLQVSMRTLFLSACAEDSA